MADSSGSSSASSGAISRAAPRATSSGTSPIASSTRSRPAGLKVVARVDNQPQWASTTVTWPGTSPPDNPRDWTDFLTALATRYRGRIHAYEIWNEPNLDREWGDKTPDPAAYTRMLKDSYQAIKAADPQALVVSAGMSPTTTSNAQAMPDLEFYPRYVRGRRAR